MKKSLFLLAPVALLCLASCSSEPSDWRPEDKVSLDLIPPGTRPSDNFDQKTLAAPSDEKGGAIATPSPVVSGRLEGRPAPSAASVMTADTKPENAEKSVNQGTSSQEANAQEGDKK